ncbi:MAG: HD domain-containing protein [Bacteroidetes bacterium]|nr:HD domain-containing protein [Bacteroidota bacterium]MDA0888623.1 HD domain-containing protein [Bacteroidota bacterium]MDA1084838.1 HD domain-containing protein [Bacteroidota bacterium]
MKINISHINKALELPAFAYVQKAADALRVEAYVIGGFVRDTFLGRETGSDIDIVAVGSGIALAKKVAELLPGKNQIQVFKNYGTAMIKFGDTQLEFVGARKESYTSDSRNPVVENGSLEDDQNRRDFTINALALCLNADQFGKLLDPFDGVSDLEKGILRTPLDPDITYSDDPLRMLRAIRFANQLDFEIEKASFKSIIQNNTRIDILSKERIVEELHKILACTKPSTGFLLLEKTGLLARILPELIALKGIDEVEGQRHKDNFYHTLEVVDNISEYANNVWLRWAALLHDIGKAPTKKFDNKVGWTFHAHEFVGAKMVYKLFKRLRMPLNEKMKYVQKLVYMSSRPIVIAQDDVTDSAVRRLIFDAGDVLDDLLLLCKADITTKNPKRFARYHQNFEIVKNKVKEVEARDHVRNFQPPVSGEEIMRIFALKPCRHVGEIKEAIKEAILEGEIPNEYEAAHAFMLTKAQAMGLSPA